MSLQAHPQMALKPAALVKAKHFWSRLKWLGVCAAVALVAAGINEANRGGKSDEMPAAQSSAREQAFQDARAEFPIIDLDDSAAEAAAALAALGLPLTVVQDLMSRARLGEYRLCRVTVWDDCSEDGDVVAVSSHGVRAVVPIKTAPVTIVLPISSPGSIEISGVQDGGGGITVAAETRQGTVLVPILQVGQTVTLPCK